MATFQNALCSEDVGAKQASQRVRTVDSLSDGDSALQIHFVRVSEAFPGDDTEVYDTDGSRKSITSFLPFLEAESQQDIRQFRFLRDAQRTSQRTATQREHDNSCADTGLLQAASSDVSPDAS